MTIAAIPHRSCERCGARLARDNHRTYCRPCLAGENVPLEVRILARLADGPIGVVILRAIFAGSATREEIDDAILGLIIDRQIILKNRRFYLSPYC